MLHMQIRSNTTTTTCITITTADEFANFLFCLNLTLTQSTSQRYLSHTASLSNATLSGCTHYKTVFSSNDDKEMRKNYFSKISVRALVLRFFVSHCRFRYSYFVFLFFFCFCFSCVCHLISVDFDVELFQCGISFPLLAFYISNGKESRVSFRINISFLILLLLLFFSLILYGSWMKYFVCRKTKKNTTIPVCRMCALFRKCLTDCESFFSRRHRRRLLLGVGKQ